MPFDATGRWIPGNRSGYAQPGGGTTGAPLQPGQQPPQIQQPPRIPETAPVTAQAGQLTGLLGNHGGANTQFPLNPGATPPGAGTGVPPQQGTGQPPAQEPPTAAPTSVMDQFGFHGDRPGTFERTPPDHEWPGMGGQHFDRLGAIMQSYPDFRNAIMTYMSDLRAWHAARPQGQGPDAIAQWRAQRPQLHPSIAQTLPPDIAAQFGHVSAGQ
jgi:hypothetical protein